MPAKPAQPTSLNPVSNITIEGAKFVYRPNFEGREEMYNEEGNRYFNVEVPRDILEPVERDGWNVKYTKPRKDAKPEEIESFQPIPYIEVQVGFKYRPPTIVVIMDGQQTVITEGTAAMVDSMEFTNIDLVLRGRPWEAAFGSGVKAYLQTFYGTVEFDDIQRKYARMD